MSSQAINVLAKSTIPAKTNATAAGPVPPGLQPAVMVQVIQPPAVAPPNSGSSYFGSSLQAYVDSGRTPSTDYAQQVQDAEDRSNSGWPYAVGFGYLGGSPLFGYYGDGLRSFGAGGYGGGYGFGYSIRSGGFEFRSGYGKQFRH